MLRFTTLRYLFVLCLMLGLINFSSTGEEPISAAPGAKHRLEVIPVFAANPPAYVFVLAYPSGRKFAFSSIDSLKRGIAMLPRNSLWEWAPSDTRTESEPPFSSAERMSAFKEFCKAAGVRLSVVPAG